MTIHPGRGQRQRGLRDNPAHRRAKLLASTGEGRGDRWIGPGHAAAASRRAAVLGEEALADAAATLRALSAALAEARAGTVAEEVQAGTRPSE